MSGLQRSRALLSWAMLVVAALALVPASVSPALAHGGKKHKQAQPAAQQQPGNSAAPSSAEMQGGGPSAQRQMGETMDQMGMEMDRSKMPFLERLVGWFGRLHPAVVHFPIAFFTAAWFTVIAGRKRPAFAAPVQFLVVAGGILAPIASIAGWLTAVDADPSSILTWHRWLGTAVGIGGLLLAIWAWRRPWEDRGAGMIAALSVMGIVVLVQAGLGATITHGVEHLLF